jgi:hypothetical protein
MKLKKSKIIIGTFLVLMLGVTFTSAQVLQAMRGSVKQVDPGGSGQFGNCDGSDPACQLHYEYWSDVFSAEINKDVTGIPNFLATPGDYRAGISVAANYPVSGQNVGENWYQSWSGELNGGAADHIGYYAAMSQKVFFGENGNDLRFNCNAGCLPGTPGCSPIACFRPTGNGRAHSVSLADGTVLPNLGGLSPIPVPRSRLLLQTLVAQLEWDIASGVTTNDGAPNPVAGYRIWAAEDTVDDCDFPEPTAADYRDIGDVSGAQSSSTDVGLGSLDPGAEAVRFAIQLLYRSTANPIDAFERRSGFTLPAGTRDELLSANGNLVVLLPLVQNFGAVDGEGNRSIISWESNLLPAGCNIIDRFRIDATKDATGLSGGGATHSGASYEVPFDGSSSYSVTDTEAGRGGSKVNVYTITVILTDGTEIAVDTIVFAHKGKTN